jgi:hypothetical protein
VLAAAQERGVASDSAAQQLEGRAIALATKLAAVRAAGSEAAQQHASYTAALTAELAAAREWGAASDKEVQQLQRLALDLAGDLAGARVQVGAEAITHRQGARRRAAAEVAAKEAKLDVLTADFERLEVDQARAKSQLPLRGMETRVERLKVELLQRQLLQLEAAKPGVGGASSPRSGSNTPPAAQPQLAEWGRCCSNPTWEDKIDTRSQSSSHCCPSRRRCSAAAAASAASTAAAWIP